MAQTIWSGHLAFGLVTIPVRLVAAARSESISFHMIHRGCGGRLEQKLSCKFCGKEVSRQDTVKGYEEARDQYILVDPSELDAIAPPSSATIEILHFAAGEEIDSIRFDASYYLEPEKVGRPAYKMLVEAMRAANRVAIAKLATHHREHMIAIRPYGPGLALSFVRRDRRIELDTEALWERKRKMVENTKGLAVWRGGETFADIGGVETIKTFLTDLMQGEEPPRVLVLLDEFEKAMAGSEGSDTSGTAQEMNGTLLSEMEDQGYTGLIFIGVAGSSKSYMVKCAGATFGIPVIAMQISQMKEKYVGSSNENLVQALAVIRALSQGRALLIATCNGMVNISGPLKRRFNLGTWMFDLPTPEERALIWPIHLKRWKLAEKGYELPADDGWTGAEIRNCAMVAYRTRRSLREAALFATPQARIDAENIDKLRQQANGRYLSASYAGFYQYNRMATTATVAPVATAAVRRTIAVEDRRT